ncbi:MAG TPA: hypothetical protein ENN51_08420 [candidate division WOR-3 bacterium]|uniref:DUF1425 domain-containing protein n=1 Tax=candidate division WOR-3 bacterium TaxID=2052148 RepID=A0A7V0T7E2_UNCW3|nr:hypothetical protein [candidate division WOR-3 bacterium]
MTRLTVTLAGLVLLLGCSARINSVIIDRDAGTRRWDVDNIFLANDIKVLDVREEVKEGALFVDILIRNGWAMPIGGKLKVQFYDKRGVALPDAWGWKQINLESSQEEWFRAIAPRPADEIGRMKIMTRGINLPGN